MRVTEVRVILTCPGHSYLLVKLMTDEPGLYGVAEAIRHFSPLLIGRDAQRIEDLRQLLYGYWRGGPVAMAAQAAIDLALWDIKGKQAGLPVCQVLGGKARNGILCYSYASGRDAVRTPSQRSSAASAGWRAAQTGPCMSIRRPFGTH